LKVSTNVKIAMQCFENSGGGKCPPPGCAPGFPTALSAEFSMWLRKPLELWLKFISLCTLFRLCVYILRRRQWHSEAKCRPGPTIKVPPFHPSNLPTKISNVRKSCFVLI